MKEGLGRGLTEAAQALPKPPGDSGAGPPPAGRSWQREQPSLVHPTGKDQESEAASINSEKVGNVLRLREVRRFAKNVKQSFV